MKSDEAFLRGKLVTELLNLERRALTGDCVDVTDMTDEEFRQFLRADRPRATLIEIKDFDHEFLARMRGAKLRGNGAR